mmetsp:Transcript_6062/g.9314  ORF Transcript_6062/g.9314 Transcript_6062/m.9314 type:complete len:100 (+) Transcript_6062:597-896(+)
MQSTQWRFRAQNQTSDDGSFLGSIAPWGDHFHPILRAKPSPPHLSSRAVLEDAVETAFVRKEDQRQKPSWSTTSGCEGKEHLEGSSNKICWHHVSCVMC